MDKKHKLTKYIACTCLAVLTACLSISLLFNTNKVYASEISNSNGVISHNTNPIKELPYTYNLGTIYSLERDNITFSVTSCLLSFDSLMGGSNVYFSYPVYNNEYNTVCYDTITLTSSYSTGNNYYKYSSAVPFLVCGYSQYLTTTFEPLEFNVNKVEFYDKSPQYLYSNEITHTKMYLYNNSIGCNCRISFLNNNEEEIYTLYLVLSDTRATASNTIVFSPINIIDRSEYVRTVIEYVPIVEEYDFSNLFYTVKQGVTNFLSVEVFPNFSLGNILLISFGMLAFTFVIRVLIK